MFWKKKPLTIRFVTSNRNVFTFAKPERATKFFPKWWKDLAKNHKNSEQLDMTHCTGFLDLYKKSIIIPAWSYFFIEVGDSHYSWSFIDGISHATEHAPFQRGEFRPNEDYQHLKLTSPWLLECDEDDVFVAFQEPFYSNDIKGIQIASGIVEPKYMSAVNINMFFERTDETKKYEFDIGYPLSQLLPLTEREFKIEHLLVSEEEYKNRQPLKYQSKFAQYNRGTKILKQCPFGGSK
jgi:hypothetical protein